MSKKEHNLGWYKKKCIDMAKILAKQRDGWTCQRCGRKKGEVQIHGSHIFPTRYGILASDPENIIALCAGCHDLRMDSWHGSPLESAEWFESKYPGRKQELQDKMSTVPEKLTIIYWQERYTLLKQTISSSK